MKKELDLSTAASQCGVPRAVFSRCSERPRHHGTLAPNHAPLTRNAATGAVVHQGLVVVVVLLLLLLAEALVLYLRGLCPLSRRVVAPMPLCDGGQLRCVPTSVARPALRGRVERAPPRRRQRHGGLLVRQPPAASTRIEVASVLLTHLVRVKVKAKMSVRGRRDGVPRARVEASVKTRAHLPTRAAPPVLPPFDKPAVPVCARGRRA